MARSVFKGPFVDPSILRKAFGKESSSRLWRIYSRRSTIIPEFVGQEVEVHNGHRFVKFRITEQMVNHKFGEFAVTRKRANHSKK